jgi:glycosyltransferase involved in cell wall biosynthesis
MKNPKISVIIPVYNVEQYLRECLNSVINQTFKDIEIICIDDGSTDNSLNILEEYKKKDIRIKVIHQENKGLSIARNNGVEIAKGRYICFIDSDDWVDKKMCETFYSISNKNNLDVLIGGANLIYDEGIRKIFKDDPYYSLFNLKFLDNKVFYWRNIKNLFRINISAWGKLYKKDFLKKINASFPEGMFHEDYLFYLKTILLAKKIGILRNNLYNYRKLRKGSITHKIKEKNLVDIIKMMEMCKEFLVKNYFWEELKKEFIEFKFDTLDSFYYNTKYKRKMFYLMRESLSKEEFDNLDIIAVKKIYFYFLNSNSFIKFFIFRLFYKSIIFLDNLIGKFGFFLLKKKPRLYFTLKRFTR